jgi:hypothetical protein
MESSAAQHPNNGLSQTKHAELMWSRRRGTRLAASKPNAIQKPERVTLKSSTAARANYQLNTAI